MNQKLIYEKFAILIALEAEKKGFPNKSMLIARANLLSRPFSDRLLDWKKLETLLKELTITPRGKKPELTQEGKKELYNSKNREIILKLLGRTMEDLGNQFIGYGRFMNRFSTDTEVKDESLLSIDEFQSTIKKIYEEANIKESRFHGLIPLDIIKKNLIQKYSKFTPDKINELLLELEEKRIIDLQIAYDASTIKEPEYGIEVPGRGMVYFLKFRS